MAKGVIVQGSDNVHAVHLDTEGGKGEAVDQIIYNTWQSALHSHILLKGEGGMGKTVQLFNIALSDEVQNRRCLVIYMPALDVNLSLNMPIDSYIEDFVGDSEKERMMAIFRRAAKKDWNRGPRVLLLVDGFNEIDSISRGLLAKHLSKWVSGKPGVQIIVSSRAEMSEAIHRIGNTVDIELQNLDDDTVTDFLRKNHVSLIDEKNRSVINSPLMLMLYTKLILFDKIESDNKIVLYRDDLNPGKLILDFFRIEEFSTDTKSTQWKDKRKYYASIVLCEYIAPRVAFSMTEGYQFQLDNKTFRNLIHKAFAQFEEDYCNGTLPKELSAVQQMRSEFILHEDDIIDANESLCLFENIRSARNGDSFMYQLVHQNFRDCLAAMYVYERIRFALSTSSELTILDKPIGAYVLPYVADIIEFPVLEFIWSNSKQKDKIIPSRADNLFRIVEKRNKKEYASLDWSNTDFRNYDLFRFVKDDKRVIFPTRICNTDNTRFSLKTIGMAKSVDIISTPCVDPASGKCIYVNNYREIRIWDYLSGMLERQILVRHANIERIAVCRDSKILVGMLSNSDVVAWDLVSGKEKGKIHLGRIRVHRLKYMTVVQNASGELRIGLIGNRQVQVLNLLDNRCECEYSGDLDRDSYQFYCSFLSYSGKYYFIETNHGFSVLHTENNVIKELPQINGPKWEYFWFDTRCEDYCYGVTDRGMVRKWNLCSNSVVSTDWLQNYKDCNQPEFHEDLPNENPFYRNLVFYSCGFLDLSREYYGSVQLHHLDDNTGWNNDEEKNKNVLDIGETIESRCLANDVRNSLWVSVASNNQLVIKNSQSMIPEYFVGLPARKVRFAKADASGRICVVLVGDDILVWDVENRICKRIICCSSPLSRLVGIDITPDGSKCIALTNTGLLIVYDLNMKEKDKWTRSEEMDNPFDFSAKLACSNSYCAVLFRSGGVRIWTLTNLACVTMYYDIKKLDGAPINIKMLWEKYCCVITSGGCIYRGDVEQPDHLLEPVGHQMETLCAISNDGNLYVRAAGDGTVVVADRRGGKDYKVKYRGRQIKVKDVFFDDRDNVFCVYENGMLVKCSIKNHKLKRTIVRKSYLGEGPFFLAYCPIRRQRLSEAESSWSKTDWSITLLKDRYIEVFSVRNGKRKIQRFVVLNEAYVQGLDMSKVRFSNEKTKRIFRQNGAKTR